LAIFKKKANEILPKLKQKIGKGFSELKQKFVEAFNEVIGRYKSTNLVCLSTDCRELYDLVNDGNIQFVSGSHNEVNGTYKINLKCSRIHLASRGFKDSIGDIEYNQGNIRIGLRSNGIPTNLFVQLI
ncbi:MAG: hypothetical protein JO297_09220, partial [Nitrososphaeraceae archaeon]|nr:hypothetical protein [Nitrososphaeraceae archaeon]